MTIFTVKHEANLESPTIPGYKSYFMAYQEDQWKGGISHLFHDVYKPELPLCIVVQEEMVRANNATEACYKFKKWMYEGLDKSFLMSEQ